MIESLQRQHLGGELLGQNAVLRGRGEHLDRGSALGIIVAAGAVDGPEGPSAKLRFQIPIPNACPGHGNYVSGDCESGSGGAVGLKPFAQPTVFFRRSRKRFATICSSPGCKQSTEIRMPLSPEC